MKSLKIVFEGIGFALAVAILVFAIVSLLGALPLMLLWNWLMPTIFGLTTVTFWQSFGLLFLSSILFKNVSHSKK